MLRVKTCAALCLLLLTSTTLAVASRPSKAASETGPAIPLNGRWNFITDPSGSLKIQDLASAKDARVSQVPGSWQSEFSDLRDYAGVAWYWRSLQLKPLDPGQVALLRFGAVDYRAVVYVNNQRVGSHDGGYLPFEFNVTSYLHAGENQIAVRVADPGANPSDVEGIKYAEIPHGKQNWYVQTSGLWQSVEIDIRPQVRLGVVHVSAGADGNFTFSVHLVNAPSDASAAPTVGAEILGPDGKVVWKGPENAVIRQGVYVFSGSLPNPDLWGPSHPSLYTLRVHTRSGDQQSYRFGFRTFETRDGKFYLNGKVIYLRGALDQAFYPETIYTPPSLDFLKKEMREAKAMGLNLLRCHIKVPDPRYLEAADETGMLVWYEIPNWDKLTADSEARALKTLRGMVKRDWNHPSIIIVSIANESWGLDLKKAADRSWLKRTYHQAKQEVPGWLVEDNSACCGNFHVATDLADFHQYDSIPDHAADFDRFVGDLATRPSWLFSPYGDAEPKGNEPLVLSEFGNWGLPFVPQEKPWWFARSSHGRTITLPAGLEKRFEDYQYNTLFPDLHALEAATQTHEFNSLKYEIGSLRMHSSIQGYVITELTDVMWESNGLMDIGGIPRISQPISAPSSRMTLCWFALPDTTTLTAPRLRPAFTFLTTASRIRVVRRPTGTWKEHRSKEVFRLLPCRSVPPGKWGRSPLRSPLPPRPPEISWTSGLLRAAPSLRKIRLASIFIRRRSPRYRLPSISTTPRAGCAALRVTCSNGTTLRRTARRRTRC